MKFIIQHDNWMYFAKIKGMNEVYTQWETPQETLENFLSVYEEIMKLKKELSVYNLSKSSRRKSN